MITRGGRKLPTMKAAREWKSVRLLLSRVGTGRITERIRKSKGTRGEKGGKPRKMWQR